MSFYSNIVFKIRGIYYDSSSNDYRSGMKFIDKDTDKKITKDIKLRD